MPNIIYIYTNMTKALRGCILALAVLLLASQTSQAGAKYKLQSGKLEFQVKQTPSSSAQKFKVNYDSSIKSELRLTQSSKIDIESKLTFNSSTFQPELISFRLKHERYEHLTQPIQAIYDGESESYKCQIDLGDPKVIQPYSDLYKLELIIADEALTANVQNTLATIKISFRYSLAEDKVPHKNSPIAYQPLNLIETSAPEARVDPPQIFTTFVLILIVLVSLIFYYGVFVHLRGNFSSIPTGSSAGMLLNLALIALVVLNLVFLGKFWLEWNFITASGNIFWLLVATALVGNYALLYLKKSHSPRK